jgi:hypothetical protein
MPIVDVILVVVWEDVVEVGSVTRLSIRDGRLVVDWLVVEARCCR